MKALFLSLFFASAICHADILPGHYSGGIISARCPGKVGGQITFDVYANGVIRAEVVDDGEVLSDLAGTIDQRGRFRVYSLDGTTVLVGTVRFYNHDHYIVVTGTGKDENCTYKFQARFRHF